MLVTEPLHCICCTELTASVLGATIGGDGGE